MKEKLHNKKRKKETNQIVKSELIIFEPYKSRQCVDSKLSLFGRDGWGGGRWSTNHN